MCTAQQIGIIATLTMRIATFALPLVISITVVSSSYALSGNEWRGLSEVEKTFYVMGVVDDWDLSSFVRDDETPTMRIQIIQHLTKCMKQMTYEQIAAIVNKWMNANPEKWSWRMSYSVYQALFGACASPETK